MRQFPVEEDLVALIWQRANPQPFEQLSFSEALRRVLNSSPSQDVPIKSQQSDVQKVQPPSAGSPKVPSADELLAELASFEGTSRRKRGPKADLVELVRLGMLRKDQELFLVDYQRNRLGQYKVTISGGNLHFKGKIYSMSALARDLLKNEGFSSDSVRGPEHWATSDGTRVFDLWEKVLAGRSR
ncbi:MAG: hypothetical protein WBJ68_11260 [Candidatus Dechloromonas phosphoritropha]|jgi:hypothetical protein